MTAPLSGVGVSSGSPMSSSPSTTAGMPPSAGRSTGSSVRMSSSSSQAGSSSISSSHVWSGMLSVRSGPSANAGSRQPHSSTSTMHSAAARSVSRLRSSRSRIQQPSFILAPGGDAALCVIRIPFTGHEGCHCVPVQKILRMKKPPPGSFDSGSGLLSPNFRFSGAGGGFHAVL